MLVVVAMVVSNAIIHCYLVFWKMGEGGGRYIYTPSFSVLLPFFFLLSSLHKRLPSGRRVKRILHEKLCGLSAVVRGGWFLIVRF